MNYSTAKTILRVYRNEKRILRIYRRKEPEKTMNVELIQSGVDLTSSCQNFQTLKDLWFIRNNCKLRHDFDSFYRNFEEFSKIIIYKNFKILNDVNTNMKEIDNLNPKLFILEDIKSKIGQIHAAANMIDFNNRFIKNILFDC